MEATDSVASDVQASQGSPLPDVIGPDLPITAEGWVAAPQPPPPLRVSPRTRPKARREASRGLTPRQRVQRLLDLPEALLAEVPQGWQRVGDVIILRLPPSLESHAAAVGSAFARGLGAKAVLQRVGGIAGDFRQPRVKLLHGTSTETIHQENGIAYALDASRTMFCPGNLAERIRMGRVVRPGEVVVDLFAGVGYFSLPMACRGHARWVYACEVDPVAHSFLCRNAALNHLANMKPLLGDCRLVAPEGVADRTVSGWLWQPVLFLPKAMRTLRRGGILHHHALAKADTLRARVREVERAARDEGRRATVEVIHRIKSYAPGVHHVVLDVAVE